MFSQAGTKPLHVVVVDDERPILDELRLFGWQECGAELSGVFTNGAEALDFCIDNEVNVIISDVVMPTMNGLEAFGAHQKYSPAHPVYRIDLPRELQICPGSTAFRSP